MNYIQKMFVFHNTSDDIEEPYISSHVILVKLAIMVNSLVKKDLYFDIRTLGFVQGLLLLTACLIGLFALKKQIKTIRITYLCLFIFIFLDFGYVAFLNSFYNEAATIIFLLLSVSFFFYMIPGSNLLSLILLCSRYLSCYSFQLRFKIRLWE